MRPSLTDLHIPSPCCGEVISQFSMYPRPSDPAMSLSIMIDGVAQPFRASHVVPISMVSATSRCGSTPNVGPILAQLRSKRRSEVTAGIISSHTSSKYERVTGWSKVQTNTVVVGALHNIGKTSKSEHAPDLVFLNVVSNSLHEGTKRNST